MSKGYQWSPFAVGKTEEQQGFNVFGSASFK